MSIDRERILRNAKLLLPQVRGKSVKERREFYALISGGPLTMMFAAFIEALKDKEKHRK